MLIVEGPDLVGKTTLCKQLVEALNARGWPHVYHHLSRLPRCWGKQPAMNYSRLVTPFVVQDRFHVSEPAYAFMRGEKPMIKQDQYEHVEHYLRMHGAYMVLVTATDDLIKSRYDAHAKREMYRLEQVLEVNNYFDTIGMTGDLHGYETHIDSRIHCHAGQQWPNSDDVQAVVSAYEQRLSAVTGYPGARIECVPVGDQAVQA